MAEQIIVEIKSYWEKRETVLSRCIICDDVIYSDLNVYCLMHWNNRINEFTTTETQMHVCNSCFEIIDN